jgi:hypothetical protein
VLLLTAATLVGAACSGGDDDDDDGTAAPETTARSSTSRAAATTASSVGGTTTTTRPPLVIPGVNLSVTGEVVQGALFGVMAPDVRAPVLETLTHYVQQASIGPLTTGQGAQGLDALFTGPAIQRLSDATRMDRSTVTDEGLAPATTTLSVDEATVGLTGLADIEGHVAVVAARLQLRFTVGSDEGTYRISRRGEVTLLPVFGRWLIDSWDLQVDAAPALLTENPPTSTAAGGTAAGGGAGPAITAGTTAAGATGATAAGATGPTAPAAGPTRASANRVLGGGS